MSAETRIADITAALDAAELVAEMRAAAATLRKVLPLYDMPVGYPVDVVWLEVEADMIEREGLQP
ncbi:hypothetical protein I5I01_gp49 [Mycobacterium phage MooMoo]|uniref:Uncharacterized protein n=1 Tax=Mycobacterium phage MooMoo TaxID=2108127 RepID=A0A2P1JR84_9CAUD|nr:hypothetical protein I5I01_gp49 [Mycobacterium phage MooMoo]AVO21654.1 hypothetical protein SEA_MOOMOO_49 [Mycobacterium phage MooMoo]